eukprot:SAG11_NODE_515_length_8826_cov_11.352469_1_plen_175_part_00
MIPAVAGVCHAQYISMLSQTLVQTVGQTVSDVSSTRWALTTLNRAVCTLELDLLRHGQSVEVTISPFAVRVSDAVHLRVTDPVVRIELLRTVLLMLLVPVLVPVPLKPRFGAATEAGDEVDAQTAVWARVLYCRPPLHALEAEMVIATVEHRLVVHHVVANAARLQLGVPHHRG